MLCCAAFGLLALLTTAGAAARRRLLALGPGNAAGIAFGLGSLVLAVLVVQHAGHYVSRAEANQRTVLTELLAQPICAGAG